MKLHKGKADGDTALLEFPKPVTGFTTRLLRKEETIQSFTGCPPCLLSRTSLSLSLYLFPCLSLLLLLLSQCTCYTTLLKIPAPRYSFLFQIAFFPTILYQLCVNCLRLFPSLADSNACKRRSLFTPVKLKRKMLDFHDEVLRDIKYSIDAKHIFHSKIVREISFPHV